MLTLLRGNFLTAGVRSFVSANLSSVKRYGGLLEYRLYNGFHGEEDKLHYLVYRA